MAQTGFTPISLYYTTTASAAPTAGNLVAGELAINTADGKLFYKDSGGVVQTLATKDATSGSFTNLAYTGTLTGGTGVVNLGSGQFYKDASGNVGIGTASPTAKLNVKAGNGNQVYLDNAGEQFTQVTLKNNGTNKGAFWVDNTNNLYEFYGYSGIGMTFSTNALERMRIDTSGNLLVGTTSSSPNSSAGVKVIPSGTVYIVNASGDGLDYYNTTAAAYRFYVTAGGTIYATNTTISAISDQRFKENVRDLDVGLDAVMALKPRKFDWKEGKGKDIKGDRGFIAQEFEQVFPDMIEEWKDPAPEGEEPYKAVNANIIPTLVKAIQEQQVMIEELKAKVAALEAAK